MTIPGAPLPRISSLLKACRAPFFQGEPWFNSRPDSLTRLYRRGRLALAADERTVTLERYIETFPDFYNRFAHEIRIVKTQISTNNE